MVDAFLASATAGEVVATLQLRWVTGSACAGPCATRESGARGGQMDQDFKQEELAYLWERDRNVSDKELVARMNSAPDLGGALLAELSAFVARRGEPRGCSQPRLG